MKEQSKEKKVRTKKKKKHTFLKVIVILLIIIGIAAAVFAVKVHQNGGGIQGVLKTSLGHDENTVNTLDKIYCVILGRSQNLTDTIMLASYDPKTQEAALLSIPRDTFVGDSKAYATTYDKINAVYQSGADNLLEDVRELTGIDVQYYLEVDTEALKDLVDEIGGVYFDVPIDMYYNDNKQGLHINLSAGYQLLDGDKAEQVVRFRHNADGSTYPSEYGGEDLGRMRTQRAFLTAVLEQTIEKMDVNMIFSFMDIAEKYVVTNLDFDAVKDYVPYIVEFNMDNLETDTLPGTPEYANGVAIYSVDEEAAKETINKLFYGIEPEIEDTNTITNETATDDDSIDEGNSISEGSSASESSINVEVLNGTGSTSTLDEVISNLESAGFNVIQTGKTSSTSNTTVINRNNELEETDINKIKELMKTESFVSGDTDSSVDLTIIIGKDYTN